MAGELYRGPTGRGCTDDVDGAMRGAMIRALNPAARLILMTEAASPRLAHRAVEHGFQAVLAKPIAPAALDGLFELSAGR